MSYKINIHYGGPKVSDPQKPDKPKTYEKYIMLYIKKYFIFERIKSYISTPNFGSIERSDHKLQKICFGP